MEHFAGRAIGKRIVKGDDGRPTLGLQAESDPEIIFEIRAGRRQALLDEASRRMGPLQDAADLGMAIAGEQEFLEKLKRYRVALARVDFRAAPEVWPEVPLS